MRGLKIFVVVIVCLILVAAALGVVIVTKTNADHNISVTLNGDREVFLEFGEPYSEQGATAEFWMTDGGEKQRVDVRVKGEVDEEKIGTYELVYSASHKGVFDKQIRKVHVTDSEFPQITLKGDPNKLTPFGEAYEEEGFTATDNYDGDITDHVIRRETEKTVTYTVTDTAGNTTMVTREIKYGDSEKPKLTLKGEKKLTVSIFEEFTDPGYTAQDNMDGDVTANVATCGVVNTNFPGTYRLEYTVTDKSGNTAKAERTVEVLPHGPQADDYSTDKTVYLTFDDGPGKYTPELLEILKKYNVKATFFVVSTGQTGTIRQIHEDGHAVAIHSATHDFKKIYASESAYYEDLNKMQSIIRQYTGEETRLLRFPGGSSNTISKFNPGIMTTLTRSVKNKGYRYFDWNVDSDDAGKAKTAEEVFANVVAGLEGKKNAIVLQHDTRSFSVDAVESIINWGLIHGYCFKALNTGGPVCEHTVMN